MPFWNRHRNETPSDFSSIEQTANQAQQDLAAGEDPRNSIAIDMMLKWLWQLDLAKTKALLRVFGAPGMEVEDYTRFLDALRLPDPNETPLAPFPVVVGMLRDLIVSMLLKEQTPLGERENFKPGHIFLDNAVWMVQKLQMHEAHDVICRLLLAANYRLQKRSYGAYVPNNNFNFEPEPGGRMLVKMTSDCLLALPPDRIPDFWAKLKIPRAARELTPVAARMRDRRAVPFMLEALPHLEIDEQSDLIVALGNIRDTRAVPLLQELAADKTKLHAVIAANALADILRTSRDDAAQLLRPTDSRHGGIASETLLRAAAPLPDATTRSDQLLRAGEHPPDEPEQNRALKE